MRDVAQQMLFPANTLDLQISHVAHLNQNIYLEGHGNA